MNAGQLKGALLEYMVRKLMRSCGFASVKPDGHYIYEQNGLFFINGKGAAHDADVLMEPPIQLPFSYPSQVLFECKAYGPTVSLTVIRNALGLRYDINEFEIVTDKTINQRKNNRRAKYAIANRKRYHYHVGIASVGLFSRPAFEFAANNKIPLLSLSWFLPDSIDLFNQIDKEYINSRNPERLKEVYAYLKEKADFNPQHDNAINTLSSDEIIGEILRRFERAIGKSFIGLNEAGDLLFLFEVNENPDRGFNSREVPERLQARIWFVQDIPDRWELQLIGPDDRVYTTFHFFVPHRIMDLWQEQSFRPGAAVGLKEEFFSRIFIFPHDRQSRTIPFIVATIDRPWLDALPRTE